MDKNIILKELLTISEIFDTGLIINQFENFLFSNKQNIISISFKEDGFTTTILIERNKEE